MILIVHKKHQQQGFMLLEVLIATAIIGLGLLGVISLQMTGLRGSESAYLRSQASISAYEILDKIRANRVKAIEGNFNLAVISAIDDLATPANLIEQERYAWLSTVSSVLPDGKGLIQCNSNAKCTITVQWDNSHAAESNENQLITLVAQI